MRAPRYFCVGWLLALLCISPLGFPFTAPAVEQPTSSQTTPPTATVQQPTRPKSWFQRHFARPTWQEILAQCSTPQDVCGIVDRYIAARTESVERWSPAQETWRKGYGDCDDFAVCVEQICNELGFEASVQLYFPLSARREGHAVVVGQWNGQMWMSSMGSYEEVKSVDDVRKKAARVIGCSQKNMWSRSLDHAEVQRFLQRGHTTRGTTTGLPATGANGK